MTYRERVHNALIFKETSQPPTNVFLTQQADDLLSAYTGNANFANECMNNHITMLAYDGFAIPTDRQDIFVDDFNVHWDRSGADKDIGVVEHYQIETDEDYDLYQTPPVPVEALNKLFSNTSDLGQDKFRLGAIGFSMFERAWSLRGMENLLMDMIIDPERVDCLLDKICDYNLQVIDIALQYNFDGFHFGDDWGQQKGLIMGPPLWRRFIKPRMKRLYDRVKQEGLWVTQHSCGDLREILDDLVDIGLNAYNTVQPEIYDLADIKQRYYGKLTFWGAISTQQALAHKTAQEVSDITRDTLHLMAKGGGYIAAPTHAVEFDVPPENILAMLNEFKNFSW